jgi:hypothetical protein
LLILVAIALNFYLLLDALSFSLGENVDETCREKTELAALSLFLFQAGLFGFSIFCFSSWLLRALALLPFWLFIYAGLCTA